MNCHWEYIRSWSSFAGMIVLLLTFIIVDFTISVPELDLIDLVYKYSEGVSNVVYTFYRLLEPLLVKDFHLYCSGFGFGHDLYSVRIPIFLGFSLYHWDIFWFRLNILDLSVEIILTSVNISMSWFLRHLSVPVPNVCFNKILDQTRFTQVVSSPSMG